MSWKAFIDLEPWAAAAKLYLVKEDHDGKRLPLKPFEFGEPDPVGSSGLPVLHGDDRDVQGFCEAIAEAAWEKGWRPRSFKDHTSELQATKAHLQDMRRISMAAVGSKFPFTQE